MHRCVIWAIDRVDRGYGGGHCHLSKLLLLVSKKKTMRKNILGPNDTSMHHCLNGLLLVVVTKVATLASKKNDEKKNTLGLNNA